MHSISRGDNNGLVYRNEQMNAMGQVEQFWYGNDVRTTKAYHPDDHLTNLAESFEYDPVYSRLTKITGFHGAPGSQITYETGNNGNISGIDGRIYAYGHHNGGPHAVSSITGMVAPEHHIAYTSFNKVKEIIEGDRELTITYGPDYARRKRVTKEKGNTLETKYYSGNYEKVVREGSTEERHYMAGNEGIVAVYVTRGDNTSDMYYLHKDHLGSIMEVTDASGSKVPEGSASFDAWGNRRDPATWRPVDPLAAPLMFDRGDTGHEHLDAFGLINMNGRMYDPVTGRFLSTNAYVQAPDFTQSHNRYSYCLNNPLCFTDPSGNTPILLGIAIGVVVNYAIQAWSGNINSVGDFFLSAGIGAASGAAGGFAGAAVTGILGTATTFGGAVANGAFTGAAGGFTAGFISSTGNSWMGGANFGQGLSDGLIGGGVGALGGALLGGAIGGIQFQKQIPIFQKGCVDLGINPLDPVPPTDAFISDAQKVWYKGAEMNKIPLFSVEKVPANVQLNMDAKGAPGATVAIPALDGTISGKSNVFFNKNLAFSSARQLFFTMGHELVHVSQYAALAGANYSLNENADFRDMLDFWAYQYQHSIGGLEYNSFSDAQKRAWFVAFGDRVLRMNYIKFPWTNNHSFKYPF